MKRQAKRDLEEKQEAMIIRDFAVEDHREGNQPFATEFTERKSGVVKCAHCSDTMYCDCRQCTLGRQTEAAPCSMCRGIERRVWNEATAPKGTMFDEWMKMEIHPLLK